MKRCIILFLIFSLIIPFPVMAQNFGQGLGTKIGPPGSGDPMKRSKFLQKGRLMPEGVSEEELREMAGFSQAVVSYQVHVLGEVSKPGTFRVKPSTRVDEVLKKAGGVNELGSNRKIKLKRAGGQEMDIDISNFRRNGDLASNPYLLDNDVVFVPFAEKLVRFEGATRINGVIELNNEKTLEDALNTAGRVTVDVLVDEPIVVVRYDKSGNRQINKVPNNPDALKSFDVQNGDFIYIPNIMAKGKVFDFNSEDLPGGRAFYPSSKEAVFVIGSISSPGAYPFNPFSSADEYVLYAGPGKNSALSGMRINTVDGKRIRGRRAANRYRISPGDIIIVPEKLITTEKALMWYNTFASTIMTGFTLNQLLKSF